ncbi:hypothetical protein [Woodsholea maritima]|uniref:hypothetical protein n=1 Tax=Woodsholea maritima TaxID=240237 RepID=UPI000373FD3A|nr:hypothetical protein [Woodsholea maritima]
MKPLENAQPKPTMLIPSRTAIFVGIWGWVTVTMQGHMPAWKEWAAPLGGLAIVLAYLWARNPLWNAPWKAAPGEVFINVDRPRLKRAMIATFLVHQTYYFTMTLLFSLQDWLSWLQTSSA